MILYKQRKEVHGRAYTIALPLYTLEIEITLIVLIRIEILMQAILYCSFNMDRHCICVIWALTIARAKIIMNIMPTHIKITIKYSLHQLFLKCKNMFLIYTFQLCPIWWKRGLNYNIRQSIYKEMCKDKPYRKSTHFMLKDLSGTDLSPEYNIQYIYLLFMQKSMLVTKVHLSTCYSFTKHLLFAVFARSSEV